MGPAQRLQPPSRGHILGHLRAELALWAEPNGYELDYLTRHDLHFEPARSTGTDARCGGARRVLVLAHARRHRRVRQRRHGPGPPRRQLRLAGPPQRRRHPAVLLPPALGGSDRPIRAHLATTFWEAKSWTAWAASLGLNALGGVYNRFGMASPRSSGGFTVYRRLPQPADRTREAAPANPNVIDELFHEQRRYG